MLSDTLSLYYHGAYKLFFPPHNFDLFLWLCLASLTDSSTAENFSFSAVILELRQWKRALFYPRLSWRKAMYPTRTSQKCSGEEEGMERWRLRRQQLHCISLPSFMLANVQALRNKMEELTKVQRFCWSTVTPASLLSTKDSNSNLEIVQEHFSNILGI